MALAEGSLSLADILSQLLNEAVEPARAVFPLAIYLVLFPDFAQWVGGATDGQVFKAEMLLGIPTVVAGLALFKWGLRKGLMPLGEQLGDKLPDRAGQVGVSVICFVLAIGLTFAEPAIGALQEAATLLDAERAPLLAVMFGNSNCLFLVVLAIGIGVGIAAVTGSLRLMHGWDIKRMIYFALIPCVAASVLWSIYSDSLSSVVGLAWDGGAVTTGPVTVPVVIALGIGLANSAKRKRAVIIDDQVELAGYSRCDDGDVAAGAAPSSQHYYIGGDFDKPCADASADGDDLEGFGIVTFASLWPVLGVLLLGAALVPLDIALEEDAFDGERSSPDAHTPGWPEVTLASKSIGPLAVGLFMLQKFVIEEPLHISTVLGIFSVFLGLVLFNLGLNFGLLPLGNAAGESMASAFGACVKKDQFHVGIALVLCFAFVGTFAAQVAEPSLNVLGETVERLTKGTFRRRFLVSVVALGVATGTCVGVLKVLLDFPMWTVLVPMYALALALTYFSKDGIVCVAWDAGGVTTGSVTVPLILAMGLGLAKKRDPPVADGFGLLGCASVFPIVSVLIAGLVLQRQQQQREADLRPLLNHHE